MEALTAQPFQGRREDPRLLTGRGRYTADCAEPGQLHAAFRRSDAAHARILRIDASAAMRSPGVRAVLLGRDFHGAFGTLEPAIAFAGRGGSRVITPPRPLLARDTVRFVGEELAVVVADSAAQALDAAELIEVEYEPLPAVTSARDALRPGAPLVHPEVPGNLCFDFDYGDAAEVQGLMQRAAVRVRATVLSPRVSAAPMEPRSVIARHDAGTGTFEIRCSNQGGELMAVQLATLLQVPASAIRVLPGDVGGGFGPRAGAYPEYAILLAAARRLGQAIRWTSTRTEDFLCDAHGRGISLDGELGLDAEGRFLALQADWVCDQGAYLTYAGPRTNVFNGFLIAAGPYRMPAMYGRHRLALTHCNPADAYRGASRPEAALLIERLVDEAARATGLDPVELRRRNALRADEFPHTNLNGHVLDSGHPVALLDAARKESAWDGFQARQELARQRGAWRGIACALFVEPCGGGFLAQDQVALVFGETTVAAHAAMASNGQGHETVFPEIIARRLGLPADAVALQAAGPTGPVISGNGTIGSRSLLAQGSAFARAADEAADKGKAVAARLLEVPLQDIEYQPGEYRVRGTDLRVSMQAVMAACASMEVNPLDTVFTQAAPRAFTTGAHVAEVELDAETGTTSLVSYVAVDDIGRVHSPALADGQIHGGIAQAAGQVLGEHCHYDEHGQLLTASFMDYVMPRADTLPAFTSLMLPTASPTNLLGAKGAGETGSTGGLAAVANAVADALQRAGAAGLEMPATPDRVWRALAGRLPEA